MGPAQYDLPNVIDKGYNKRIIKSRARDGESDDASLESFHENSDGSSSSHSSYSASGSSESESNSDDGSSSENDDHVVPNDNIDDANIMTMKEYFVDDLTCNYDDYKSNSPSYTSTSSISEDNTIFVFPTTAMKIATKSVISMKRNDLNRLMNNLMLSDNNVQYMLQKLYFSLENVKQNSVFFYDTLFYGQLMDNEINKFNYNLVKMWTKRTDIFEKDLIFIPINQNKHWSLLCILGLKNVKWIDGKPAIMNQYSAQENVPCILVLDSLNIHPYEKLIENILK